MTAEETRRETDGGTVVADAPARVAFAARARSGLVATFARRRHRVIAGVAVAAVALGSGTSVVYAAAQDGGGEYRTALAEIADVTETLALSGQLASADSSDVAFQVSGTVDSVLVALGDQVAAGQRLATIDATDLEQAVTSARDAVASAEQSLEDDLEAQSHGSSSSSASSTTGSAGSSSASEPDATGSGSSGSGSSGSGASGSGSGSTGSSSDDAAMQKALEAVTAAQQTLLEQYETAASAGEESSSAVAQAEEICAPFLDAALTEDGQDGASAADGTEAAEETAAEPADEQDSDSTDDSSSEDDAADGLRSALETVQVQLADCQGAIVVSEEAQSSTQAANSALMDAATTLDEKVATLRSLLGTADSAAPDVAGSSADGAESTATGSVAASEDSSSADPAASPSSGSASAPGSNDTLTAGSGSITAERILADRAAIDLAEAELAIAEQNLTFASITSPISGTVVSVGMAVGDAVASASATAVITVQGDGGYVVQATVTLSRITGVEVGQSADVTLPAFGATYTGEVTSIGVLNVSTTSTPSYTVTVSVDAGDESPRIGATADVDVQLADAVGVLTVPTSAVTRTSTGATVTRLIDGTTEISAVTLGATGAERTEIIDGLSEGDIVVLADLNQVITADEESETGLTGLGGSGDQEFTFPDGAGIPAGGFSDSGGGFTPPGN